MNLVENSKRMAFLFTCVALTACSATTNAPKDVVGYVADAMVTMALAANADEACPGLSKNETGVEQYERSLDARLESDGFIGDEKQDVLQSVILNADRHFPPRIDAFGEKHELVEGDVSGFCKAVHEEVDQGTIYSKLLNA